MTLLFCDLFESLTADTICKYLKRLGKSVVRKKYYTPKDLVGDHRIDDMVKKDINQIRPDAIMTVNFWPPVSRVCHKAGIKYISYSYDSPINIPEEAVPDMVYETNFVFLFDREEAQGYINRGIDRVFHAPLATDVELWDSFSDTGYSYDISLIGSLYKSTFPSLMAGMDEYYKGYYKAVIASQQKVYGYYMVNDLIKDTMDAVNNEFKKKNPESKPVSIGQMSYSVGSYINYLDRLTLLRLMKMISEGVHLFTGNILKEDKDMLKGVNIHGSVDYNKEMPKVFKASKINLNPTSRVIRTGVPQRVLDVLGCKAFLLSSYQPETAEYFIPGEEIVLYDSYEDALEKARFYLVHKDIREKIANKAYEKIRLFFTYNNRLQEIFEIVGLD